MLNFKSGSPQSIRKHAGGSIKSKTGSLAGMSTAAMTGNQTGSNNVVMVHNFLKGTDNPTTLQAKLSASLQKPVPS